MKTRGGGRLDHLGNPPDMSKYLKKKIACGADFWMVENKGGEGKAGGGKAANSADRLIDILYSGFFITPPTKQLSSDTI